MADKELIRKVQDGSPDVLNIAAEKYYDDIYRFCLYLTGNETESYDITQTVFMKFIKYVHAHKYKNLKGYLLIIARNVCRDYFAHRKNTIPYEEERLETAAIDRNMEQVENHMYLWELLQRLPELQREVIILHVYEDMKFKDIANITGSNVSTIKSRYQAGMDHLKNSVENGGGRYGKKQTENDVSGIGSSH